MRKKSFQPTTPTITPLLRPTEPGVIFFAEIDRHVLAYAPIHYYVRPWCDGRYSRQALYRLLNDVADQESWHALKGVEEHRALHSHNTVLVEVLLQMLDGRDEQRVMVAA
jgi:hypothetical protein